MSNGLAITATKPTGTAPPDDVELAPEARDVTVTINFTVAQIPYLRAFFTANSRTGETIEAFIKRLIMDQSVGFRAADVLSRQSGVLDTEKQDTQIWVGDERTRILTGLGL